MIKSKYFVSYFLIFLCFMGLLPLLPFHQKPIGLVVGLLFGGLLFVKEKSFYFSKQYIFNALPFFIYFLGIINSDNTKYVYEYLQTSLPFILFPIVFMLFSKHSIAKEKYKKAILVFYQTYIYASTIISLLIFLYAIYLGYFNGSVSYSYLMSYLGGYFWGFHTHPIYISLFLSIAILFQLQLIFHYHQKKILLIIGSVFIFTTIVFLSRKGVILSLLIAILFYIFIFLNNMRIVFFIIFGLASFFMLSFLLFSNTSTRFKELFNKDLITNKAEINNSTSTRIGIYKCSIKLIKNTGVLGYGLGDIKTELNNCFKKEEPNLVGHKFNTHNVYFNILLGTGYLGFILFLFYLYQLFNFAKSNNDILYLSILLLFVFLFLSENILDRQNGVLLFAFIINFFTFKDIMLYDKNEKK